MKSNATNAKSVHVPPQAHIILRKLQLRLDEEKSVASTLGDLAGALIALGTDRSLDEIIVQLQHLAERDSAAKTATPEA